MGEVFSVNISLRKGTSKSSVKEVCVMEDVGIKGDAHAGFAHRQVSLLSWEDIEEQNSHLRRNQRSDLRLKPGDFAENITTKGIELSSLKIGDKIRIGSGTLLEVTQIGKKCHDACEIFKKIGKCIMPKQGIFTRVLKGGNIGAGDVISLITADKR